MTKEKVILAIIYKENKKVIVEKGEDCNIYELYGIISVFKETLKKKGHLLMDEDDDEEEIL